VARAGPTHCSGEVAMGLFREAYGADFIRMGVGAEMSFSLSLPSG